MRKVISTGVSLAIVFPYLIGSVAKAADASDPAAFDQRPEPLLLFDLNTLSDEPTPVNLSFQGFGKHSVFRIRLGETSNDFEFDRFIEIGGQKTWVGTSTSRNGDRIYISPSIEGLLVTAQSNGERLYIDQSGRQLFVRRLREKVAKGATSASARRHNRAVVIGDFEPTRLHINPATDALERLRATQQNMGRMTEERPEFSESMWTALAIDTAVDLRPFGHQRSLATDDKIKRPSRLYHQFINNIPVQTYASIFYDPSTHKITEFNGRLYSEADAPLPAPEDLDAQVAISKALEAIPSVVPSWHGGSRKISHDPPRLVYFVDRHELRLGWIFGVFPEYGPMMIARVDVKSGELVLIDGARQATCDAKGLPINLCGNPDATIVIDSNGQCQSDCGGTTEARHRAGQAAVEASIADFKRNLPGTQPIDPEIDVVVNSRLVGPGVDAIGGYSSLFETEAYVAVSKEELLEDQKLMTHEAAHIFTEANAPGLRPLNNPSAGANALAEGIAYILEETMYGDFANLEFPNAHANEFQEYEPGDGPTEKGLKNAENSKILRQAVYEFITTANGITVEQVHRLVVRSIIDLPRTGWDAPCGAACMRSMRGYMRGHLEAMKDNDEINGTTERAWRDALYAAFNSVFGTPPPPPSPNPPPPPAPFAPFITATFNSCDFNRGIQGITWYEVSWAPVLHAEEYLVYRTGPEQLLFWDTDPPFFVFVDNATLSFHLHACGPGGCSGHGNTRTISDTCAG